MIRMLIVDDHDLVRMGMKQVFDSRVDMEVTAEASTGEGAIALIRKQAFDVALVDLSLSDMSGVDVLVRARAIRPEMAVLIVSGYPRTNTRSTSSRQALRASCPRTRRRRAWSRR